MSEENKKETAIKAVETPKNEELVATTPVVEKTPVIKAVKAKKAPKKRIKKEVEAPKTEQVIETAPVAEEVAPVIEEVKAEEPPVKKVKEVVEFDWDKAAQNDMYSKKERSDLETEYSATIPLVIISCSA